MHAFDKVHFLQSAAFFAFRSLICPRPKYHIKKLPRKTGSIIVHYLSGAPNLLVADPVMEFILEHIPDGEQTPVLVEACQGVCDDEGHVAVNHLVF